MAGIADAIRFAADNGAKVINMSLGGPFPSRVLKKAVEYAHKKGVVVVCAAGNESRGKVGYPAAYPGAIAVAPARTIAGVLGMVRTTRVPAGKKVSRAAMLTPAATETTREPGLKSPPRGARTLPTTCGFTATTRMSTSRARA